MRLSSVNITEMYNSLAYRQNTSSFAVKTSTKDSTEGSHLRLLTEPVRTLQMTNATHSKGVFSQPVQHLRNTQAYIRGRCRGHRGGVRYIHQQCSRSGAPAVNHIYYVYLRWGFVFMVWVCLLCWGIWVGTGGGWVRYMKAGGVLKGLGVIFTVHKTDWL